MPEATRTGGAPPAPWVSVIIPVLNDAAALTLLLERLEPQADARMELVVVDGGSSDDSLAVARRSGLVDQAFAAPRGRGAQLACGMMHARGCWLWLLHADSVPEPACLAYLLALDDRPGWGRFSVRLHGRPLLRAVARLMNWRSCLTGICTGDQAMFVHRDYLQAVGGMPAQALMEDIELSKRLKQLARPRCRAEVVGTSARRWLRRGVVRTILGMWLFRLRY
jgi:rSAM/selenodomain-associated transferase 2